MSAASNTGARKASFRAIIVCQRESRGIDLQEKGQNKLAQLTEMSTRAVQAAQKAETF
jgi:hypothetical protein